MNVWHLAFRADSVTYTVASALSRGGHDVFVWVVDPAQDNPYADRLQRRLRDVPRVRIIARDEAALPSEIDRLVVQVFPRPTESLPHVDRLARRARTIALITAGDRSRTWRGAMQLQWLEARKLARHARRIDRVLYKDGYFARDLHGLFAPRHVVGFDVHSHFLHDEQAFRAIHARDWSPGARRPVLVNFVGSRDPAVRERLLDAVRPLFRSPDGSSPPESDGKATYWHEYSDAEPRPLDPLEFVNVLSRSDFTLCPRGYSVVTHRPMEALLRGSIPVLSADELDLYGIPLEDGKTCIAVPAGHWPQAIEGLAGIGEGRMVEMRRHVHELLPRFLDYDVLAKHIRARLGVEE
jgi:hypothetical protein